MAFKTSRSSSSWLQDDSRLLFQPEPIYDTVREEPELIWLDDDHLYIKNTQEVPDYVMSHNRDAFYDSMNRRAHEVECYASMPEDVFYDWIAKGYDCRFEKPEKNVAMIKRHDMQTFITSCKV